MRRDTCNSSASLKAAGAVRSELSRNNVTSAVLRAGRLPEPEKMTSSMPEARMFLYEFSPITQRRASTRLDLPQPLGPTTPVNPSSMRNSVGSTKDLNPRTRSLTNLIRPLPAGDWTQKNRRASADGTPPKTGQRCLSMAADIASTDISPESFSPLMKKVGVESTL